jgi:hypothetical protein
VRIEDVCLTNRVLGLFQSTPVMLSPVGDTSLDTIADGIAASLSRDDLVLLIARLAVNLTDSELIGLVSTRAARIGS